MADNDMPDEDVPDLDDLGDLGDEETDEDDAPAGDEDTSEWKPPTKGEWERAQRRLKKYAAASRRGKSPDEQLASQLRGKPETDDAAEDDGGRAELAAADQRTKRAAGIAALMGAGLTKDQAKRAVGLIDLRNVELDDDGDADLEDEIDDLKEQFPDLFQTTVRYRKPPTPGRRTPDSRAPRESATQRADRKLLAQAGFEGVKTRRAPDVDARTANQLREAGYL
jgi:hypothetical protein